MFYVGSNKVSPAFINNIVQTGPKIITFNTSSYNNTNGLVSYDGVFFNNYTINIPVDNYSRIIEGILGNGISIILKNNMYNQGEMYYSTDKGVTWTKSNYNNSGNGKLVFGNDIFLMINLQNKSVSRSSDGITWENINISSSLTDNFTTMRSVFYGNGKFFGIDEWGQMAYSTDNGSTWTKSSISDQQRVGYGIYAHGKYFVAGNGSGTGFVSSDGVDWEDIDTGASRGFALTKNNIIFNKTKYSTDGITWQNHNCNYLYGKLIVFDNKVLSISGNSYSNNDCVFNAENFEYRIWTTRMNNEGFVL